jgi:hypothetical protein
VSRFTKNRSLETDVSPVESSVDIWQRTAPKESPQTIRNISRIEQLEAGQADLKKVIKQIQKQLWLKHQPTFTSYFLSWEELANKPYIVSVEKYPLWLSPPQLASPYQENLSKITELFGKLEEDFDDISRRITRCAVLEEELATLENSLEDEKSEYLASCVSLIRDVLDYNYAEDLAETHLELLKKSIGVINEKGLDCNKEDYQNLHREFLQSGLTLLPTSRKAIDRYELTKTNDGI